MADQLLTGTTLVEKESRSAGDVPVGCVIEWTESETNTPTLPTGFVECNGQTLSDPLSIYNGEVIPNFNENYWNCGGYNFVIEDPVGDDWTYDPVGDFAAGAVRSDAATKNFLAPVFLPQGAVVTGAIVTGSNTANTWTLYRNTIADAESAEAAMAGAVIGTEDTTIANATIDNDTYFYFLNASITSGHRAWAGKITYSSPVNKIKVMRVR